MKKILLRILTILIIFIILILLMGVIFYKIDYSRVQEGKLPKFCIKLGVYADGGTTEYLGLGYKVIAFNKLFGYNEIKIGGYNMKYEDFETESDLVIATTYCKMHIEEIPKKITPTEAAEKGYFVYDCVEDKIYNKEVLDKFVKNTEINAENRISDKIMIFIYNVGGDPTIYYLTYKFNENVGYILGTNSTRIDLLNTELIDREGYIDAPAEYYETIVKTDIPSEYYGITVTEDHGIGAGIINLKSYDERYKDIEVARYMIELY